MKNILNGIKNEFGKVLSGIGAVINIVVGIICVFLVIGLFTGRFQDVLDNLILKHYYIYGVKTATMVTGQDVKEFYNDNFTNVEWDFEREGKDKTVMINGVDNNNDEWTFLYSVNDNKVEFKDMYANGDSLENYVSDKLVDSVFGDDNTYEETYVDYSYEDEQYTGEDSGSSYQVTPLGDEFFIFTSELDYDTIDEDEFINEVLDLKISGSTKSMKKCLEDKMEDLEYSCTMTNTSDSITITGYHKEQETKLSINMSITEGRTVIKLDTIYMNNKAINMEDQILFARDIFY